MSCNPYILPVAVAVAFAIVLSPKADGDIWGEKTKVTGAGPVTIHLSTTYLPQYLSRNGREHVFFGRFFLGMDAHRVQCEGVETIDGSQRCFVKRCCMGKDEYRHFKKLTLFFDKERKLLYKIVAVQDFPRESMARDRMTIVDGVIKDCEQGYGLSLIRTVANENRVVYQGSDDILEVSLELRKLSDGIRQLIFTSINKKIRTHEVQTPGSLDKLDIDEYTEVQL